MKTGLIASNSASIESGPVVANNESITNHENPNRPANAPIAQVNHAQLIRQSALSIDSLDLSHNHETLDLSLEPSTVGIVNGDKSTPLSTASSLRSSELSSRSWPIVSPQHL